MKALITFIAGCLPIHGSMAENPDSDSPAARPRPWITQYQLPTGLANEEAFRRRASVRGWTLEA